MRVSGGVLDLLAPARCLACRRRAALPWCDRCRTAVRTLPDGCRRCAAPRSGAHACWPADAPIDATVAVQDYRGPVAAGLATTKLAGARAGWGPLATLLAQRVAEVGTDADVVTFVTTPASRVRARGLDHARVLGDAVARATGLPLARLLDAREGPDDRDRYRARLQLPATNVLLVDDVLTTGATAWRVAAALQQAGAGRIELAVLARAGSHPLGAATRRG